MTEGPKNRTSLISTRYYMTCNTNKESTFVMPSRYYSTLLFGLTVKFGPSVQSSG